MAIRRWEPVGGIDDLFGRVLPRCFSQGAAPALCAGRSATGGAPSAASSQTEHVYRIRVQLPGGQREDIEATLDPRMMAVSAARRHHNAAPSARFDRIESFHGAFARRFALPDLVNSAAIQCDTGQGVLTMHRPERARPQSKPVQVH